jgi:hypothetical protein
MKGHIMKLHNPASFEISDDVWNAKTQIEQIRYIADLKRRTVFHVYSVVLNGVASGMLRVVECNTETDALVEMADTIEMQSGANERIECRVVRITTPRADADLFVGSHRHEIATEVSS